LVSSRLLHVIWIEYEYGNSVVCVWDPPPDPLTSLMCGPQGPRGRAKSQR